MRRCLPLGEKLEAELAEEKSSDIRNDGSIVGKSVVRVDAWDKVTGKAQYVDDIPFPGCWYGGTVEATCLTENCEDRTKSFI